MTDGAVGSSGQAFRGRLEAGRSPALVVIDVARAYCVEGSPFFLGNETASSVVGSTSRLIDAARAAHRPVVFTEVRFSGSLSLGGVFMKKVPQLELFDGELGDLASPLEIGPNDVLITKQYASAFFGTPLAAYLTAKQIDSLVLCGFSTSGCVRATAVDACQHGFIPIVVGEACGDRPGGTHDANLFDIQAKYGEVVSEEQASMLFASR